MTTTADIASHVHGKSREMYTLYTVSLSDTVAEMECRALPDKILNVHIIPSSVTACQCLVVGLQIHSHSSNNCGQVKHEHAHAAITMQTLGKQFATDQTQTVTLYEAGYS